jgi:hypothetical protein
MVVAAFVVSIAALLVAGASAGYTRTQAAATKVMAHADAQRRHDERAPEYVAQIEDKGSWFRLVLRLHRNGPVSGLTVLILEPRGVQFSANQDGIDSSRLSDRLQARFDPPALGESTMRRIEWPEGERPKQLRIRMTSDDQTLEPAHGVWTTLAAQIRRLAKRPVKSVAPPQWTDTCTVDVPKPPPASPETQIW